MSKGRKKRDKARDSRDGGKKSSDFKAFLKKRAPIYLGLVALFLVFVVPEFTKGSIDDVMPELGAGDQQVVDALMSYSGPNKSGLEMRDAISDKITEEFGDRIYSHQDTRIDVTLSPHGAGGAVGTYDVALAVQTHRGELEYAWNVDPDSGLVTSDDQPSKNILNRVNFYD